MKIIIECDECGERFESVSHKAKDIYRALLDDEDIYCYKCELDRVTELWRRNTSKTAEDGSGQEIVIDVIEDTSSEDKDEDHSGYSL